VSNAAFNEEKFGSTVELVIIGTTCGEINDKLITGIAAASAYNSSRTKNKLKWLFMLF